MSYHLTKAGKEENRAVMERLLRASAKRFGVDEALMFTPCRKAPVVEARFVVFMYLRSNLGWTWQAIARAMPYRYSHSDVISGVNSLKGWMSTNLYLLGYVFRVYAHLAEAYGGRI